MIKKQEEITKEDVFMSGKYLRRFNSNKAEYSYYDIGAYLKE